ncbi:phosphotransferase enzyme family protein [Bacillus rubiinfantis]|uniref:phosphotransferase enzyme family protein n=1 Tax=Bacillus rubiinfantis TaxID=1499680 RepID=UPI0005A5F938|nr:phosphotransferase [Bacillus rubiinfantis]
MRQSPVDPLIASLEKFNEIALNALAYFPFLTSSTLQLLNYSENSTYLVEGKSGDQYILRVGRPLYHTKEEINSELAWLQSLDKHVSIKVSLPVVGAGGEYVHEVTHDNISYYCVVFTFLNGISPDEENEDELVKQFQIIGEITAHLHQHSVENRDELKSIKRLHWDYDAILGPAPKWGRWQDGLAITSEREALFEQVAQKIKKRLIDFGKGPDRYGLIHSDLRLANLLVEGNDLNVIDFDDCGYGWYVYDIAASLSFIEHKPYVPALISSWLKGYRKVRPLTQEEEQEIPTFIMMRRLQLIAWVGSRDNETTRELGSQFTEQTDELAKRYLADTLI